jgi:hypothetical protein
MPAAVKAPKRKTTHIEPEEDSFAEGIIKGLQDFKEGRITRFKDAERAGRLSPQPVDRYGFL